MNSRKIQKGIIFSSESVKEQIECRAKDLAVKYNQSVSYVLETTLLDGIFPKNHSARYIVIKDLYPENGNGSVRQTLDDIFAWNNAGIDWSSKHDNFRALVEFCLFNIVGDPMLPKNNPALQSFLYSYNSVLNRTEKEIDSIENIIDKSQVFCSLDYAKTLYEQAKGNAIQIGIKFFYELFLDLWSLIKGWAMTYRALSALAAMSTFRENAETRNALVDLVDQISKEWD